MITEARDLDTELLCCADHERSLGDAHLETIDGESDHLDRGLLGRCDLLDAHLSTSHRSGGGEDGRSMWIEWTSTVAQVIEVFLSEVLE